MKTILLTICLVKKVFISSNLTIVLLSFPRTCLPSSSLVNACFFYFLEKSEFPIKEQSGTAALIRAEAGNEKYDYFFPMNDPDSDSKFLKK